MMTSAGLAGGGRGAAVTSTVGRCGWGGSRPRGPGPRVTVRRNTLSVSPCAAISAARA